MRKFLFNLRSLIKIDHYLFFLILFTTSYFFVILNSGYFSDDAYSQQIKGILEYEDQNLFSYTLKTIKGWIVGSGRMLIFSSYHFILFYFLENLIIYKIIVLIVLTLVFTLFYFINIIIFKLKKIPLLLTIFSILSLQLREFHDPILGFHGFIPFLALLYLIQLYLLLIFNKTNKKKYYYLSSFVFFICNLSYEIAFLFLFFNFFILNLYFKKLTKTLTILKPHIYIFIISILIFFIIQIRVNFFSTTGIPDYKIIIENNFFIDIFKAFFFQITSAIPSSYFLSNILNYDFNRYFFIYFIIILFFIFLSFLYCLKKKIFKRIYFKKINRLRILFCSLSFLVFPSLLILISPHKEEVLDKGFGYGYIFNFFSCFGVGYLILFFFSFFKKINFKLILFFIFMISVMNSISNLKTVLNSNIVYKYPDRIISKAIKKGIFDKIYDDQIVIRQMRYPSDRVWNYVSKTNKKILLINPDEIKKADNFINLNKLDKSQNDSLNINLNTSKENIWALHYFFDPNGTKNAQFFLGKVDEIILNKKQDLILQAKVNNMLIYQEYRNRLFKINLNYSIDFIKLIYDSEQKPIKYFVHTDLNKYKF